MYQYAARVVRVVDGDTLDLEVDLGFRVVIRDRFRLAGINAPELSTSEGQATALWLKNLLYPGSVLQVDTHKDSREKYGRWLAVIWQEGADQAKAESINDQLVRLGLAVRAVYLAPESA